MSADLLRETWFILTSAGSDAGLKTGTQLIRSSVGELEASVVLPFAHKRSRQVWSEQMQLLWIEVVSVCSWSQFITTSVLDRYWNNMVLVHLPPM